ncbi:MAG: TraX family protein [Wujia sp.]
MDSAVVGNVEQGKNGGLTGSTLKMIAMVTMLIDHFAATVLTYMIMRAPDCFDATGRLRMSGLGGIYWVMRGIGRLAFPIFIFLLLEGFLHTRNRFRYIGRLLLFAAVSEIPFDFAFSLSETSVRQGHIIEFTYQNVFFTLAIGLIVITALEGIRVLPVETILRVILFGGAIAMGTGLAYAMHTDYDALGVLAIVSAYLLRNKSKELRIAVPCLILSFSFWLELVALIDILPVSFYNGERGWKLKWVFYLFYPVHLFILAGICYLIF